MKRITTALAVITLITISASPAFAFKLKNNLTQSGNQQDTESALEEFRTARQEQRKEKLGQYGQSAADQRIQSLTKALNQVQNTLRISEENKGVIQGNLQNAVSNMEALKEKMQNAADYDELKGHIESMFYDYRIYAVELPKNYGLKAVGIFEYAIENHLEKADEKLDKMIAKFQDSETDTVTLDTLIVEYDNLVAEVKTKLQEARDEFNLAKPAKDTTEARAHIDAGREKIQEARELVNQVRAKLQEIVAEAKDLKNL